MDHKEWQATLGLGSHTIARTGATIVEAFSLLANPCHYWVSDGGQKFSTPV